MKQRILWAYVLVGLLGSSAAVGEILSDVDWYHDEYGDAGPTMDSGSRHSSVSASDDGYSECPGYAYAEGERFFWTTESDICAWYYDIYVWAEANLTLFDGETCLAYGEANASAEALWAWSYCSDDYDGPNGAFAWLTEEDFDENAGTPQFYRDGAGCEPQGGTHQGGSYLFNPGQGVYSTHNVAVHAWITPDSWDTAYAHACATGDSDMHVVP